MLYICIYFQIFVLPDAPYWSNIYWFSHFLLQMDIQVIKYSFHQPSLGLSRNGLFHQTFEKFDVVGTHTLVLLHQWEHLMLRSVAAHAGEEITIDSRASRDPWIFLQKETDVGSCYVILQLGLKSGEGTQNFGLPWIYLTSAHNSGHSKIKTTHGAKKIWFYIAGEFFHHRMIIWDLSKWSYNQGGLKVKGWTREAALYPLYCVNGKTFLALLDSVSRGHGMGLLSVVRLSCVSQLSLNLMHWFISNFICGFSWTILRTNFLF